MNQRLHVWLLSVAVFACASVAIAPIVKGAAEDDHLVGYQITDQQKIQPAGTYTITNEFGSQSCTLKKAKFFLVHSAKNGGDDPRGGPAGDFVCYQAKCTGALPPATTVDEQFATHTLTSKKTQLVCAPANLHVCGDGNLDPGETCDPPGNTTQCPGAVACSSSCTCPPPPCTGQMVGGFCWYLAGEDQSCDALCSGMILACDPATVSYAGSGGTTDQCKAVVLALVPEAAYSGDVAIGAGLGCVLLESGGLRDTGAPTTCAASASTTYRACACH